MLYHNTNVSLVVVFISFGGKGGVQTVTAFLVQMRDFLSKYVIIQLLADEGFPLILLCLFRLKP